MDTDTNSLVSISIVQLSSSILSYIILTHLSDDCVRVFIPQSHPVVLREVRCLETSLTLTLSADAGVGVILLTSSSRLFPHLSFSLSGVHVMKWRLPRLLPDQVSPVSLLPSSGLWEYFRSVCVCLEFIPSLGNFGFRPDIFGFSITEIKKTEKESLVYWWL